MKLANELSLAPTIIARRVLGQYFAEKLKHEEEDNAFFSEISQSSINESALDSSEDGSKPLNELSVLSDVELEVLSDGESELSNETGQPETSCEISQSSVETQHSNLKPFKAMIRLALQDTTVIDDLDLAHEIFLVCFTICYVCNFCKYFVYFFSVYIVRRSIYATCRNY